MALDIPTLPFPPFQPSSSSDSITLTPRSSFYTARSHCATPDTSRPCSLSSIDSGYASTAEPQSDLHPMRKGKFKIKHLTLPEADTLTTHTSGESSKSKKVSFLQRRKKSPDGIPSEPFHRNSWLNLSTPLGEMGLSSEEDEDVGNTLGPHSPATAFQAKHHFATRRGMIHHPYPPDQAPYMQAYDRTLLDNDRFSDILLQRLSSNGTPSFLSFNGNPPSTILDVGCGAGHWAIRAARHWPKAKIIGIDLIAPSRLNDGVVTPSNVEWRQMNFVGHRLGFPSDMFDLVRMANLSLCIPLESWKDVLSEVNRVLAPGGHLELIDDQILFPTIKPLERPPAAPEVINIPPSRGDSYLEFDDDDDDDDGPFDDEGTDDDFKSTRSRPSSIDSHAEEVAPFDVASEWTRNEANVKALEGLFTDMLWSKYKICADQRGSIDEVLEHVFGPYNSQRVAAMTLAVAPPASTSDSEPDRASLSSADGKSLKKRKGEAFKQWISVEWDKVENKGKKGDRSSGESVLSPIPEVISLKAAGRLGISPSAVASPSRSPRSSITPQPSRPTQPPGLVLWPNTLIELEPFELEMHVCKHMHSLLGCKAALYEYAEQLYRNADGKPLLDDAMFDDLIWDYDCFRRKRFNWPSMSPETENLVYDEPIAPPNFRHSVDLSIRPRPRGGSDASMKQSESSRYSKDDLTFVRSIYVYSASKMTTDDIILS